MDLTIEPHCISFQLCSCILKVMELLNGVFVFPPFSIVAINGKMWDDLLRFLLVRLPPPLPPRRRRHNSSLFSQTVGTFHIASRQGCVMGRAKRGRHDIWEVVYSTQHYQLEVSFTLWSKFVKKRFPSMKITMRKKKKQVRQLIAYLRCIQCHCDLILDTNLFLFSTHRNQTTSWREICSTVRFCNQILHEL